MANRLRNNVIANIIGRSFSAALAILFTPLYIHFLGIEAYGVIGFYITLQASISFLEMGLSRACNRELARLSAAPGGHEKKMASLLRSLEFIYWFVALIIGISLFMAAPWISSSWLKSNSIPQQDMHRILVLAAIVISLRWPLGLYFGALMGLQKQVLLNMTLATLAVLNWAGSALVLWAMSPDLITFFYWQILVGLISVAVLFVITWRVMPSSAFSPSLSLTSIREMIPFAAGLGLNTLLGTLLLQADKLLVSALLPLDEFGYYILASTIVSVIALVANSVSNAAFPRFSQMVGASASIQEISDVYHLVCQAVSALILPGALVMAFFAQEVIFSYTGNLSIANETATVLVILSIAKLLHSSMVVPYALQLAYGWVRVPLYINLLSLIWLLPATYWLTLRYGIAGSAYAWLVVALGYVMLGLPIMHKKLLKGGWHKWILDDFGKPFMVVALVLLAAKFVLSDTSADRWQGLGLVIAIWLITTVITLLSLQKLKNHVPYMSLRK